MNKDRLIFSTSIIKNLKSCFIVIIYLLALGAFNIYAFKQFPFYDFSTFLISVLAFMPGIGPPIFLHLEYLKQNWDAVLEIDRKNKKIMYVDRYNKVERNFNEIDKIIQNKVKDTALLYGFYEYYEIKFIDGDNLFVTNLMVRDLSIPEIEEEIVERYFPSIYFS